jgi:DNA-binding MarR family transcriptional regulator
MSIDKDIQQRNFRNEYQKATVNVLFSAGWINERMKQFFGEVDITPQQYNILRILRGSQTPLSTQQVRDRMLDKMSDASRIVDRLIKKELVNKSICTADKRLVDIVISSKGLALLQQLDDRNKELDSIAANLTEAEAKTLNTLLDKMRASH